jgi:hypothetical protein
MNQSSATAPLGLSAGPPVSPPDKDRPELREAPAPDQPAPLRPPPEADLVESGRLSMGQLAQAHRDRLETGKPVLDVIVERGWVSAEEVAELRAAHGIEAPPPAPVQTVPEPEAVPEPTTEPTTEPAPMPAATAAARYTIAIRLSTGELIEAGETEGSEKAAALGLAVVADLTKDGSDWPFFGGRYLNPETIVSVDLLPADSES